MSILTRDQILATKIPTVEVNVPEWGGSVLVRGLTGLERERYLAAMDADKKSDTNPTVYLVIAGVVDEAGSPVFDYSDADLLLAKSLKTLLTLSNKVIELSGLSAKAEEDLEKNSEPATTEDSSSV
jgi:hypothetical protein